MELRGKKSLAVSSSSSNQETEQTQSEQINVTVRSKTGLVWAIIQSRKLLRQLLYMAQTEQIAFQKK